MSILSLFKNNEIKLTKKRKECLNNYSFSFQSKSPIKWRAGQHGIFKFKGEKLEGGNARMFSLASAPHEKNIIIGTKIGDNPSAFKAKLKSMEVGQSIYLRGPFGSFSVSDHQKNLAMIAGGIGITPMRAILKDLAHKQANSQGVLFYIDSQKEYAFKDELEKIKNENPKVHIMFLEYIKDLEEGIMQHIDKYKNNSRYLISGSPNMVKEIKNKLRSNGVKNKNIIHDSFRGYK